ncbi:MAG: 6-hydroxymethylpterin diphosphokinase MptE-like protein [Thermoprotei archaeon]
MYRHYIDVFLEQYNWIREKLSIDKGRDEYAARVLDNLLKNTNPKPDAIYEMISGRNAVVFGAGPSLLEHIRKLYDALISSTNTVIIAADGATQAFLELGLAPDIIVTDLDGDYKSIEESCTRRSLVLVHAHGDNIDRLYTYVPRLLSRCRDRVIGTTQTKPYGRIYNFGGFTDGDRGVYLAVFNNAERVLLAGMDLGIRIGRYSGRKTLDPVAYYRKLVKFEIAYKLLSWISCNVKPLYTLNPGVAECSVYVSPETARIIIR